jgi:hypothetical protein
VIIAFEVLEHVDCLDACLSLLKPGGKLLATSPVPERDWILQLLEKLGANQKRTSEHDHLLDFRSVRQFQLAEYRRVAGLSQWGVFVKPTVTQPRHFEAPALVASTGW